MAAWTAPTYSGHSPSPHPLHHFFRRPPRRFVSSLFAFALRTGSASIFFPFLTRYPSNGPLSPKVELRSLKPRFKLSFL